MIKGKKTGLLSIAFAFAIFGRDVSFLCEDYNNYFIDTVGGRFGAKRQ
jgi:hypothetical protein